MQIVIVSLVTIFESVDSKFSFMIVSVVVEVVVEMVVVIISSTVSEIKHRRKSRVRAPDLPVIETFRGAISNLIGHSP